MASFKVKDIRTLTDKAMKVTANELTQLVEGTGQLLAKEHGRLGNLRIAGRLAHVRPKGELTVVGDLHGDLESLVHVLSDSGFMEKAHEDENSCLVFLGDYGDRGFSSPEVYYIILTLKELFPENIVLMKGNHEGPEDLLAYPHDLPINLQRKFGEDGLSVYRKLRQLFDHLYNAVLVDERCILVHGGVPSRASTIEDLAYAHEKHPQESHLEEILWSDPAEDIRGTYPSPRGAGRLFGEDITDRLLGMFHVKALIRGHEPSRKGFKINHHGKILTLFSRKGPPYYNTHGAYLHLNLSEKIEDVKQLKPYIQIF